MRKKILLAMALTGLSALMITGCASPVIESKKKYLNQNWATRICRIQMKTQMMEKLQKRQKWLLQKIQL